MYDILIKNGKIVDGAGTPWYRGNVAVKGDHIVAMGPSVNGEALHIIDAPNLMVCPGFIDAHSHSDLPVIINPRAESKVRQGVTTEIIGQCGSSAAPRVFIDQEIPTWVKQMGFDLTSLSMAEYLSLLDVRGMAVNVVPLIGHGTIREQSMGSGARPATAEELQKMKALVAKAMEDGAFGITTGLIYPPSSYAPVSEIHALAEVVAKYNGLYATHMRNEGNNLLASVEETLAVGRHAQLPLHISHYKVTGAPNWGTAQDGFDAIEQARQEGIDVTLDQYPYIAASNALKVMIPSWAHDGGVKALTERMQNPIIRAQIREEMLTQQYNYESVLVSSCAKEENKRYEGLNLWQVSQMRGQEPVDATLDLLLEEDFETRRVSFAMCEEDVAHIMQHPLVMFGSDASCLATTGPLSKGKPHPRAYGTFARILGRYVREQKVLPLEEAIRKMTSLPAARFNLWKRGLLRPGTFADITIFNADTIADSATFTDPHQYALGIEYVLVNGQLVVDKGTQTDHLPGKALRRI